jgi:putative tryptophan/tyrosine transport system substrate-binding protein
MRRRNFITGLASTTAGWPVAARAQQPAMPVIGLLNAGSPAERVNLVAAFRQALSEAGYIEGQNVSIEYRWAENQYDRLPALAADLIRHQVMVIATPGSTPAALAAKAATTTIPIVFSSGSDPVKLGLVASFSRPGGNVTGVSFLSSLLVTKQFDLLHELTPMAQAIGLLVNPKFPDTETMTRDAQTAAVARGKKLIVVKASTTTELDLAFTTLVQERVGALLVPVEPFLFSQRERLAALAADHAVPAIYSLREFVDAGGLMSYGASNIEGWRQVGVYTSRILKGERPADLPVVQSARFELVINLKTAKALSLDVPMIIQMTADEVIE